MVRSASREPIEGRAALDVLDGVTELVVAKGKKSVTFDLENDRPGDDELLEHLLGRSGKLRAPTIRVGRRLVVGFSADVLEKNLLA